jgi:uncharacterized protein YecT (DUF1311 family)
MPVRVKKTRQNKKLEPRSDSIGTEKALARSLLLTATLSMAPSLARADDADLVRCINAPTGSEQKQCTQVLSQNAEDEMNKTYAGVLEKAAEADARTSGSGDGSSSVVLSESQRAWEVYRDAECKGVVGRGGGSGSMVWVFGCLAEKTRERIRELKAPFYQR